MSFDEGESVDSVVDDISAPAEYGITQVAIQGDVDPEERRRLREEYGWIRTFFKTRPVQFENVQRWLNQARFGVTYDEYLARTTRWAGGAAILSALVGVLLSLALVWTGLVGEPSTALSTRGDVLATLRTPSVALFAAGLALVSGALSGVSVWAGRYYYPLTVVSSRRQAINVELPHAIVFLYALSHGGMDLTETIRTLATSRETYGEVAREFGMVVNDGELFGSDLFTSLQNARNLTPSESMEQFLDDMLAVLESGGDVTTFLEQQSEAYLRDAHEEQENFLETLSLLAEVFIVLFVAAPLFLIITLVVISLLGGSTVAAIELLIYLVLPVGVAGFLFLVHLLSQPFQQATVDPTPPTREYDPVDPPTDDERYAAYARDRKRERVRSFLADPLAGLRREPRYALVASVPLAVLTLAGVVTLGLASPTAVTDQPVQTTTALVVAPFVIATLPLSVAYERKRRRELEIARRFPDTLNVLSSANKMGIRLSEGLELVSRWSVGPVAEELRLVRNDVGWHHNPRDALLAFGHRLAVPQLSRSMKLLSEGLRSSSDLSRVLAIAAEDTRNREKMERDRRRELASYIAVVVIGFLVYLLIVAVLDATYLQPLEAFGEREGAAGRDLPVSLANLPIDQYQLLFFHSALVQAVGAGLIAGKLSDNNVLSGLKYVLALMALSVAAFLLI